MVLPPPQVVGIIGTLDGWTMLAQCGPSSDTDVSFTAIYTLLGGVMGILCDSQIRELVGIEPFEDNVKRQGRISFGVSSYGYDVRVGTLFKIFTNVSRSGQQAVVDPKAFTDDLFVTIDTKNTGRDHVIIPPNSFALCETVEVIAVRSEER